MHADSGSTRLAFTLFEIGISLLILAVAVLGVSMVFPVGLRAQQMSRFKLYAGIAAMQLMEGENSPGFVGAQRKAMEAEQLGQCANTLSIRLENHLTRCGMINPLGFVPLPDTIARRLDSDNDEIQRLLQQGGRLFYCNPKPPSSSAWAYWTDVDMQVASDVQKVIVGVIGYPSISALSNHPCIFWPAREYYPAPPTLTMTEYDWSGAFNDHETWRLNSWTAYAEAVAVWGAYNTAAVKPNSNQPASQADVLAYVLACQNLVSAIGPAVIPTTMTAGGPVPNPPPPLPTGTWTPGDPDVYPQPYKILALRWLAHAAAMLTGTVDVAPTEDQKNYARDCFESCLQWAHRYAHTSPYDWGAARISQSLTAWDFPLLQFDLFSPQVEIDDGGGNKDHSWKVIGSLPVTNHGRSISRYGNTGTWTPDNFAAIDASFGDPSHFVLNNRFEAAARCRQLVFWAVDWQSYEDFESAPSIPFDSKLHNLDSRGVLVTHGDCDLNPERDFLWSNPDHTGAPGSGGEDWWRYPDWELGNYGADRNSNGIFDQGPVATSVKLRALLVARFNFYDERMLATFH